MKQTTINIRDFRHRLMGKLKSSAVRFRNMTTKG